MRHFTAYSVSHDLNPEALFVHRPVMPATEQQHIRKLGLSAVGKYIKS